MHSLLKSINRSILKEMYEDSATDVLSTIISRALAPAAGKTRLVIKVSLGDLKSFYLKATGAKEFVDHMTDDEVTYFRSDTKSNGSPLFCPEVKGKTLAVQTKPDGDLFEIAVLLDVPTGDLVTFKNIDKANLAELRAQLVKILSTTNYKMAIYTSKLKAADKIKVGVDSNEENFNPVCLANYPSRKMLNDAIDEWQHHFGRAAQENRKTDDAAAAEALAAITSPADNTIKNVIIASMATVAIADVEPFIAHINGILKTAHAKIDVVKVLNAMEVESPTAGKFDAIATAITNDTTKWKWKGE